MAHPQTAFASQAQGNSGYSPLNILWLLHTAMEGPLAFIALFFTDGLAFKDEITNTMAVVIKMYATLALSLTIVSLLLYGLPDYLPGKRAAAILLLLYHGVASSVLLNAEPFVDFTFPDKLAKQGVRVETVFGVAHGLLSLLTVSWWQASLASVKAQSGSAGAPAGGSKGGKRK
ncbi:hypothetical protein NDA18_003793 [Ustilago nuda]|nr:hypothetical protein NDA18_003793 [Ustilago nuda]